MTDTHTPPPPRPDLSLRAAEHRPAWRDTAMVVVIALLSLLASARLQLSEAFYSVTRRWEYLQLDELSVGLLVLAIGLIWLARRRYRQAHRELRARYRAEAALSAALVENRRLAQEHLRMQESERKHLARELHDQLGQYLNAIKLDAVSIAQDGDDAALARRAALGIVRSVDHVHGAVGDMIRRLRPVGLDELGLTAAIEHCIEQWRRRVTATQFDLSVSGSFDGLGEDLTLTVYRLIQESLNNVYRHADATRVQIVLQRRGAASVSASCASLARAPLESDELYLAIADDGRGLPAQQATPGLGVGFGLSGMRERVELAGGSLTLQSAPGQGLRVAARLPVREQGV